MPLAALVLENLPNIISFVKELHAKANPDAPPLTDDDVKAALQSVIASEIAKDENWQTAHPITPAP